jgi:hypothetical protein
MRIRNQEFDELWPNPVGPIAARLTGAPAGLPPLSRDEDPADILVDLAEGDSRWRDSLRAAAAQLLSLWANDFDPGDSNRVAALGELCYLAARIGSTEALEPLRILASRTDATGLVAPGEHLRLRALRALVGLLGFAENVRANDYRETLLEALGEPPLALTALTGLVGLWPSEREDFLRRLPPNFEQGELIQIGLDLAFRGRSG